MKRRKGPPCALPSNEDNDSTIPNKGYFSARCAKVLPKRPSSGTFYLTPFRAAGRGSMNHEQAMLMKSSRVSDLNTPWWEEAPAPRLRRAFPEAAHHRRFKYWNRLISDYILSGTCAAGRCRSQGVARDGSIRRTPGGHARRTCRPSSPGTSEEYRGDLHGTGGSRDFRRRAADGSRVRPAADPDLLLNLIHSLCIHLVIHFAGHRRRRLACRHDGPCMQGVSGNVPEVWRRSRVSAPTLTQQELAALLASTAPHSTRILCRLKALNIIEKYTKNDLHILDMEALDRLARGDKR